MHSAPVIGIAGTAKNTGKTTTLNALMHEARRRSRRIAVTGIGYDGEEKDTITGLPKPRIRVEAGDIVATADRCVLDTDAALSVYERTGIITPLGEVVIGVVQSPGLLVIAGPGRRTDLRHVVAGIRALEPDIILVDGSLNRIAPFSEVDSVIITTGAARSQDLRFIAQEVRAIDRIFQLPASEFPTHPPTIHLSHLIDGSELKAKHNEWTEPLVTLSIRGLVCQKGIHALKDAVLAGEFRIGTVEVDDPFILLMENDIIRMEQLIAELRRHQVRIVVRRHVTLTSVTVNPFVPLYEGGVYRPGIVNTEELSGSVRSSCTVPVFDIAKESAAELFELLSVLSKK